MACLIPLLETRVCIQSGLNWTVLILGKRVKIPGGLMVKNPSANAGDIRDVGSVPVSGRCHGGGHGKPLQYSCLENPMDRGSWRARSIGSQTVRHHWSDLACTYMHQEWVRGTEVKGIAFLGRQYKKRVTVYLVILRRSSEVPFFLFFLFRFH